MRRPGWEERLDAVIDRARSRPYELGSHDCFRVACQALEALTAVDRWPEFAGRYATKREALRVIARYGSSFEAAFDWFFGRPAADVKLARRGDIMAIQTDDGEKHLGVCLGVETALLAADGLVFVATLRCLCCWRIE